MLRSARSAWRAQARHPSSSIRNVASRSERAGLAASAEKLGVSLGSGACFAASAPGCAGEASSSSDASAAADRPAPGGPASGCASGRISGAPEPPVRPSARDILARLPRRGGSPGEIPGDAAGHAARRNAPSVARRAPLGQRGLRTPGRVRARRGASMLSRLCAGSHNPGARHPRRAREETSPLTTDGAGAPSRLTEVGHSSDQRRSTPRGPTPLQSGGAGAEPPLATEIYFT